MEKFAGVRARKKQKEGSPKAAFPSFRRETLEDGHVLCLPALGAFDGIELHSLTFRETFEATRLNCRKVHEDILAVLAADKAKSFCVVNEKVRTGLNVMRPASKYTLPFKVTNVVEVQRVNAIVL